jgi:hypothetical protein
MRWLKLVQRYSLIRRPTLRAVNPRVGTSIIPLDQEDDRILFQYLTNKLHSLHFEGSELQLTRLIRRMCEQQGLTIQKMRTSEGRGREKLLLLHLRFADDGELRRLIKLS